MDEHERYISILSHSISLAQHLLDCTDIILHIAGILTVSGGKGKILEFFGPGAATLGTTAMSTVCNMSAEIGSTSCIFPYSDAMGRYLAATDRDYIAAAARENLNLLQSDDGSEKYYDEIIEIDLRTLEPHINGPFTPDLSHTLSSFAGDVEKSSWPKKVSHAMIGSCTNASFEDLSKAAILFREARGAGLKPKMPVFITAGSEKIRATVEREGILEEFEAAGATILSNSCGPCVGQWNRKEVAKVLQIPQGLNDSDELLTSLVQGTPNSVVSSYNRNFVGRHDSNPETHSFVTSPELVAAFAFAGSLQFNPATETITTPGGRAFAFSAPHAEELPSHFEDGTALYQAPPEDGEDLHVHVAPDSDNLQLLTPFEPWVEGRAQDLSILIKVQGE
jgi:aconitate hydratase